MKDVGTELNPTNAADHIRIEELYALTATELDDGNRDFVRAMTHDYRRRIAELLPLGGTRKHGDDVSVVNGSDLGLLGDAVATRLGVPDPADAPDGQGQPAAAPD